MPIPPVSNSLNDSIITGEIEWLHKVKLVSRWNSQTEVEPESECYHCSTSTGWVEARGLRIWDLSGVHRAVQQREEERGRGGGRWGEERERMN